MTTRCSRSVFVFVAVSVFSTWGIFLEKLVLEVPYAKYNFSMNNILFMVEKSHVIMRNLDLYQNLAVCLCLLKDFNFCFHHRLSSETGGMGSS